MCAIKAFVVGVSDYTDLKQSNLPFCINDIHAFSKALTVGLKVKSSDIVNCGEKGKVATEEFISTFQNIISNININDTFIFYFSGHGCNDKGNHFLVLSDGFVNTQDLIELLGSIKSKNKIIIFDSCMSGNFKINKTPVFLDDVSVDEFMGKGYAVFSSSNAIQYSYGHPNKPISLFTNFLCEAIMDKYLIREGRKSLNDIKKLLFLYLSLWNKNYTDKIQSPIFRSNMGGTIYFNVENYEPYPIENIYEETEKYIIYSVKSLHNSEAKRYSAQVILKEPFSLDEIAQINHEIVEKLKYIEIYHNKKAELFWKGKSTNIIFCYFGRDELDMINSNYLCHTTWIDPTQDENWWYKLYSNCEVIRDIHFNIHTYYDSLKTFTEENTGIQQELYDQTLRILRETIVQAEKLIQLYNEFVNGTLTEALLVQNIKPLIPFIDTLYFQETSLSIAPKELKNWCQACSNLVSTIHDFTLFYNEKYLSSRTYENRMACMDMTIKRYYNDLEKVKNEDYLLSKSS